METIIKYDDMDNEIYEQKIIDNAKSELYKTIRTLSKTLDNIDLSEVDLKEIEQYNLYLLNVIRKVKENNLKDVSTTKQINKSTTIALYKKIIYNYISEGNFFSINQMCKDLGINRKSFYNYKLNEYLKDLLINNRALFRF